MHYDIIIIGGGMVGASLACALATKQSIALIDATPLNTQDDPRLIALNYRSQQLLQTLQVWEALTPHAAAIQQVHISDRGRFGITRLHASDINLPALGYVVPAKFINAALNTTLSKTKVDILRPATLQQLSQTENKVTLTIKTAETNATLTANLVIAADGTHSTVREQLNIATTIKDYQQSALVTVTHTQRSHHNIAYERFHQSGAIAMLPLTENRVATIWTDKTEVIQHLLTQSDEDFLQTLQKNFGYRNGRFIKVDKRHSYPLTSVTAEKTKQQNVILLGNAAHTLHPIAAQGLNLALAEITQLTEILNTNPTTPDWPTFLSAQQKQQATSHRMSHALPAIFTSDFLPIVLARQLGLLSLDLYPPLKRRFIRKAIHN